MLAVSTILLSHLNQYLEDLTEHFGVKKSQHFAQNQRQNTYN